MQILYEFVLAKSDLCFPFILVTRVGHRLVNLDNNSLSAEVRSSVLVVEEAGDSKDFLDFFSQQVIIVHMHSL